MTCTSISNAERKLSGMLLAYTKQVELPPLEYPHDNYWLIQSFLCSTTRSQRPSIGITWGITHMGREILDSIVTLLRREVLTYNTRRDVIKNAILKAFQENCLDASIFDGDKVLFLRSPNKTLFDCHAFSDRHSFSKRLLEFVFFKLQRKAQKNIFLCPLNRIVVEADIFNEGRFTILNSSYIKGWEVLRSIIPALKHFDPVKNMFFDQKLIFQKGVPSSWLAYHFDGDFENSYIRILNPPPAKAGGFALVG
jgi:hypothetical protein